MPRASRAISLAAELRRGELQGLKRDDLDLEAGTLQVHRTLSEPKGGWIFEAPKSDKGRNVQELLGHADMSLTLNVYSPILPDMGNAAGAMDAALG